MNSEYTSQLNFKPTFRSWLNQRWLEHKDEVLEVTGRPCDYDLGLYFNRYKWWLKKMYKEQRDGTLD